MDYFLGQDALASAPTLFLTSAGGLIPGDLLHIPTTLETILVTSNPPSGPPPFGGIDVVRGFANTSPHWILSGTRLVLQGNAGFQPQWQNNPIAQGIFQGISQAGPQAQQGLGSFWGSVGGPQTATQVAQQHIAQVMNAQFQQQAHNIAQQRAPNLVRPWTLGGSEEVAKTLEELEGEAILKEVKEWKP